MKCRNIQRIMIFCLSLALLLLLAGCGEHPANPAQDTGEALHDAANALANADVPNPLIRIVGEDFQEDVSEEYFSVRVTLWKVYGAEDPVEAAIDSMKREASEKQFAEAHGLMPSEEEIKEYVDQMRSDIESDEESRAIVADLLSAIGFSQEYYWNQYKPKYEAPAALIHAKVTEYIAENGLQEIDISKADYEVLDQETFQKLTRDIVEKP